METPSNKTYGLANALAAKVKKFQEDKSERKAQASQATYWRRSLERTIGQIEFLNREDALILISDTQRSLRELEAKILGAGSRLATSAGEEY
jgi:hypothetical protein